jgi:hypothetical protein
LTFFAPREKSAVILSEVRWFFSSVCRAFRDKRRRTQSKNLSSM